MTSLVSSLICFSLVPRIALGLKNSYEIFGLTIAMAGNVVNRCIRVSSSSSHFRQICHSVGLSLRICLLIFQLNVKTPTSFLKAVRRQFRRYLVFFQNWKKFCTGPNFRFITKFEIYRAHDIFIIWQSDSISPLLIYVLHTALSFQFGGPFHTIVWGTKISRCFLLQGHGYNFRIY